MTPRGEPALPVEFYKKISIVFVLLTTVLFGVVLYMTILRATIEITPKKDMLSADLLVDSRANPKHNEEVLAQIFEIILEKSGTFKATATSTEKSAPKQLDVMLYNDGKNFQILIPKTRLLSPDGFIYRIQDRLELAAGRQKTVTVVPDIAGSPAPLSDTKLTVPGLGPQYENIIYAKTLRAVGEDTGKIITVINQADIENGFRELENDLTKDGQAKLKKQVTALDNSLYIWQSVILEKRTNGIEGEQKDSFDVSLRLKLVLVATSKAEMFQKGENLLLSLVPQDKTLLPVGEDRYKYDIVNYSVADGTALVKLSVSGSTVPRLENPLIQSARFAGLSKDEVAQYLKDTGIAEEVKISTIPPWLKKLPTNPERIKVILKEN